MAAGRFKLITMCSLLLLTSCATLPTQRAWRPWTRVLEPPEQTLVAGAALRVDCDGITEPAFGRDELLKTKIASDCRGLLARRGFVLSEPTPGFHAHVRFSTRRESYVEAMSSVETSTLVGLSTRSSSGTAAGAGVSGNSALGLGVAAASAIQRSFASGRTISSTSMSTQVAFEHQIALEVSNGQGQTVWEGDARWATSSPDIENGIEIALKMLGSRMPSIPEPVISVPEVRSSHLDVAYWLDCSHNEFAAPGLPYVIGFEPLEVAPSFYPDDAGSTTSDRTLPSGVRNGRALYAYIDLLEHAEIALPLSGGQKAWSNPLDPKLWRIVQLGGRYALGPKATPICVLVTLTGNSLTRAYQVTDARIASEEEYSQFHDQMNAWSEKLAKYYDLTVH